MPLRDPVTLSSSWTPPNSPSQLPYIREADECGTPKTESSLHSDAIDFTSSSDDALTESDIVHFATKIGRRWACNSIGHEICFVSGDLHMPLSDEQIMTWVGAWYEGRATVTYPPEEVFGAENRAPSPPGLPEIEPITPLQVEYPQDIPLSTSCQDTKVNDRPTSSLYRQPYLSRSPYLPDKQDHDNAADGQSVRRKSTLTQRSVWSPSSTIAPSSPTPTSRSDSTSRGSEAKSKGKWLGAAVLLRHGRAHIAKLKKYQKRHQALGKQERIKTLRIIGHAVEMSRKRYSSRVHKLSCEIARELQKWLQIFTEQELHASVENVKLLLVVQACLIPILLRRVSEVDPGSSDLASNLSDALTKIPLPLQDSDMSPSPLFYSPTSTQLHSPSIKSSFSSEIAHSMFNNEDTPTYSVILTVSSVVINLVANELGSEEPTCKGQHPWLGLHLLRIVEMTLKLRQEEGMGLTRDELDAIWTIGMRREEQLKSDSIEKLDISPKSIRPHEVALLALCASSLSSGSLSSFFTLSVLGRTGVPLLVSSLNSLLESQDDVQWEEVALILRALAFLSEHAWVIRGLSNTRESGSSPTGLANERVMIKALLAVFRRSIPERWLSIRFWAMDTIRNMLGQRPGSELVRILTVQDAITAFESLFDSQNSKRGRQSSLSSRDAMASPRSPSHVRAPPDDLENVRQRMKENYQREASLRAEELVRYLRIWERVADEDEVPDLRGKTRLNVVSIGYVM